MKQVGIKLPKEDLAFLEWYSEKSSTPVAGLYRQATYESFRQWKLELILKEYQKGTTSFKKLCDLANISLLEGMIIIEKERIEPPIPNLVDDYTIEVTRRNIQEENQNIHKKTKKKPLEIKLESDHDNS